MKLAFFVVFIPVLPHNLLMLNENDVTFQIYLVMLHHLQGAYEITSIQNSSSNAKTPNLKSNFYVLITHEVLIMHKTIIYLKHLLQLCNIYTVYFYNLDVNHRGKL